MLLYGAQCLFLLSLQLTALTALIFHIYRFFSAGLRAADVWRLIHRNKVDRVRQRVIKLPHVTRRKKATVKIRTRNLSLIPQNKHLNSKNQKRVARTLKYGQAHLNPAVFLRKSEGLSAGTSGFFLLSF